MVWCSRSIPRNNQEPLRFIKMNRRDFIKNVLTVATLTPLANCRASAELSENNQEKKNEKCNNLKR